MDIDDVLSFMPHGQHRVEHTPLSLAITMPQECSNAPSSHTGATSSGVQSLFQSGTNWDWGVQGRAAILPLLPPSNTRSPDKASLPHHDVSTERNSVLQDVALDSLMPIPEERAQELRLIRAKPVASPLDTFINSDCKDVKGRTLRRALRRRGRKHPLDAETKEGAAFMRKMHACPACFVNNLKVSINEPCQGLD